MNDVPPCDFALLQAQPSWQRIDFLSDLHLCDATPRTTQALHDYLERTPAQAVFVLGDLFEAWVGDDARLAGGEREVTAMLKRASGSRWIGFMAGNRDFLVGEAFARDTGVHRLHDPTLLQAFGQRILLTHGDLLCTEDADYQAFRRQVRSHAWQSRFLARPLAERQQVAHGMRDASRSKQAMAETLSDVTPRAVDAWMHDAQASLMIHGHTHRPALHAALGGQRAVLSDWDCESSISRGDVLTLSTQGLQRLDLSLATRA